MHVVWRRRNFVHRGIAARSFERRFVLDDHVEVRSPDLKDGLLAIEIAREIPEEMKPRRTEIRGTEEQSQLTDQRGRAINENEQAQAAA